MIAKRHTLVNALRTAASVYGRDADDWRSANDGEAGRRMAKQFDRQVTEAHQLADAIEQADSITLED